MSIPISNQLRTDEIITPEDFERISLYESSKPFSLHWELKTLLYLGVLLLNIGLGIVIYKNIDSIGHVAILSFIGLLCVACFVYCFYKYKAAPFTSQYIASPTPYFDYILLLGCLTFLIFEGYWQFQYNIFGTRYGLVTIIPTIIFFITAYYFDHRGALSLAITGLASWVGIVVTPKEMLTQNDFHNETIIYTGVLLGIILTATAYASEQWNFKKHFSFTYMNFGVHIFFISALAGLFSMYQFILFIPLLIAGMLFFIWYARETASLYFLTVATVYGYIGLTYLVFKYILFNIDYITFPSLYFIITCPLIIMYLIKFKKEVKVESKPPEGIPSA